VLPLGKGEIEGDGWRWGLPLPPSTKLRTGKGRKKPLSVSLLKKVNNLVKTCVSLPNNQ
jgi:hypothetical protein